MILSVSNPLKVAAWFAWRQGEVWVNPDAVSTQTKACLEPSLTGRSQYNQCTDNPSAVGTLEDVPRLLWQLPRALF